MRVLGIDTSCDETSVALLEERRILAGVVCGQDPLHRPFGGIVPEIASRAHAERMLPALEEVLERGGGADAVAVTNRPGLIGPLLVGLSAAKALAFVRGLPLVGVHHLEAHVAAAYLLTPPPVPPFVALIASGGHTVLYEVPAAGRYVRLGQTTDDAAGECFDKCAAVLGLPYPGGPAIEEAARGGDPAAVPLPRPLRDDPGDDFSFSGLKTAVLYRVKGQDRRRRDPDAGDYALADVAAAVQEAIADVLSFKAVRAARRCGIGRLVLGGGVAANARVRELAAERAGAAGIEIFVPPRSLCTDNAAMVAVRGAELFAAGVRDGLDLDAQPYAE
ncbi:MAG: tRNA (adenosine(37)-N6)-threonylcarbamoyltransferase complex transferase subunit TsaD [Planctomycetota bacterium]|jgi:N6-L-threonylcarbamoyladenine synthase